MTPLPTKDERIVFRAATEDLERWRAAAEAEDMPLSMWIRRRLNAALAATEPVKARKRVR